jgi:cytidylate kinase
MRYSTDINDITTLLLIVDSFQSSDNGVYQCIAEEMGSISTGPALELTGSPLHQLY